MPSGSIGGSPRGGGGPSGWCRSTPPNNAIMEPEVPSPWQALPPFLAARVLSLVVAEPRWTLVIPDLRLISRGWCDAIGEALPVLAPPRYLPADAVAAAAARFPGLRLLRLDTPGEAA